MQANSGQRPPPFQCQPLISNLREGSQNRLLRSASRNLCVVSVVWKKEKWKLAGREGFYVCARLDHDYQSRKSAA